MFDFFSQIVEFLAPYVVALHLLFLLGVAIICSLIVVLLSYYLARFAGFVFTWQPKELVGVPRDHRLSDSSAAHGITAHEGRESPSPGDDLHANLPTLRTVVPHDAFSHCTLGVVYYSQGRYDDAIDFLQRAIEINPGNATAHHYLGLSYAQKGMPTDAAEELAKAHQLVGECRRS